MDTSRSPHVRLRPLPLDAVKLADDFWEPRRRINRDVTLPSQYRHLEETGRLDNFRRASGKIGGEFQGIYFNDSDVYKWLEAAAWTLAEGSDPELERMVDDAITEVEDAQRPDGYLNTYFTFERATKRWTDFDLHEMYCAGHLFQAAVAHFRATGSERLLDVATRFADHICDTFGPEEDKRHAVDGHQEVEMALVELVRVTGERRYLDRSAVLRRRPRTRPARPTLRATRPSYSQDHEPFRDLNEIVGHAVRAVYLYAGVADLYAETGEPDLLRALERLWQNMTTRRMYVSGGLGSRYEGEAFGEGLRAAQRARLHRDLRRHRQRDVELAHARARRRSPLRRPDRTHPLQRRPARPLARRPELLLPEPARRRWHPPPPALVRLRLLPAQRGPPSGLAARLRLQYFRRRRLGPPLRRGCSDRRA